jgi:hypothetical protein
MTGFLSISVLQAPGSSASPSIIAACIGRLCNILVAHNIKRSPSLVSSSTTSLTNLNSSTREAELLTSFNAFSQSRFCLIHRLTSSKDMLSTKKPWKTSFSSDTAMIQILLQTVNQSRNRIRLLVRTEVESRSCCKAFQVVGFPLRRSRMSRSWSYVLIVCW